MAKNRLKNYFLKKRFNFFKKIVKAKSLKNRNDVSFSHVHTREGGGKIRTYDLRFIRRGSQPIDLTLGDRNDVSNLQFIVQFVCDGKNMAKTKMKKLKFKHIIFHYKLKICIKIYLTSLN